MNTWKEKNGSTPLLPGRVWMTVVNRLVEWRAKRLEDPLDRLRYLRRSARTGARVTGWRPRKWHLAIAGVLLASLIISAYTISTTISTKEAPSLPRVQQFAAGGAQVVTNVWLVDRTPEFEAYSNGLRIEKRYQVSNEPRGSYPVFPRRDVNATPVEWRTEPAGIVYHTTESQQAPFEADENRKLQRVATNVLERTQQNRSYHFVIDRFGRVFRIVQESDVANHAGYSIWGDDRSAYINLNNSFLGVAFETQTALGQDLPSANAAQIHAARVLTQMLRNKFHIAASNCVTHAQVSVNPSNMLMGYHTDWSGNFPFSELGLDDNYVEPPASIDAFGFSYDSTFINATGTRLWQGLILAEEQVRAKALSQGLTVPEYRKILRHKFKEILATLKSSTASKEKSNAT
jgi:hypothetical protein